MDPSDRYLRSLAASWSAFARVHPGAELVHRESYLALVDPAHPVLTNAAILGPRALPEVLQLLQHLPEWAVWSWDAATASALETAGLTRDVTTRPMLAHLDAAPSSNDDGGVLRGADVARVAELNGTDPSMLVGVEGLRAYLSDGGHSGLVVMPHEDDVHVSMVATRPESRRRGLAGAVLRVALEDMRLEGYRTATLQSRPRADGLYARSGFTPIATWQEWTARPRSS